MSLTDILIWQSYGVNLKKMTEKSVDLIAIFTIPRLVKMEFGCETYCSKLGRSSNIINEGNYSVILTSSQFLNVMWVEIKKKPV